MKFFTVNNLANLFQIAAVILLLGYAAFPDTGISNKKPAGNTLQVNKLSSIDNQVMYPAQNKVYISNTLQQHNSKENFIWVIPDMKMMMNPHLGIAGAGGETVNP